MKTNNKNGGVCLHVSFGGYVQHRLAFHPFNFNSSRYSCSYFTSRNGLNADTKKQLNKLCQECKEQFEIEIIDNTSAGNRTFCTHREKTHPIPQRTLSLVFEAFLLDLILEKLIKLNTLSEKTRLMKYRCRHVKMM